MEIKLRLMEIGQLPMETKLRHQLAQIIHNEMQLSKIFGTGTLRWLACMVVRLSLFFT